MRLPNYNGEKILPNLWKYIYIYLPLLESHASPTPSQKHKTKANKTSHLQAPSFQWRRENYSFHGCMFSIITIWFLLSLYSLSTESGSENTFSREKTQLEQLPTWEGPSHALCSPAAFPRKSCSST